MCRHVLNAKVTMQAGCCGKWFECSECHDEVSDHLFSLIRPRPFANKKDSADDGRLLRMACKTCQRVFERDLKILTESDKYCESCFTQWCLPGVTPESVISEECRAWVNEDLTSIINNAGKPPVEVVEIVRKKPPIRDFRKEMFLQGLM